MRRVSLIILGVILLGGFGAHFIWTFSGRKDFEERVELLRASGAPIYTTDLATPSIPDEENAAKLLEEAHAWLERYDEGQDTEDLMLYNDHQWTAEERNALWRHLEGARPFFEMVARIPERPGWHLDLDWSAGPGMRVDCIWWLHKTTGYLVARVKLDPEEQGRTRRAAETAILLLDLSERFRLPYLMGRMILHSTTLGRSVEVLRIAQDQPGFDAALFRRLVDARVAAAIPPTGPPASVFVEERASALWIVRAWLAGETANLFPNDRLQRSSAWHPLLYRDASRLLDEYQDAIDRCDTSPEQAALIGTSRPPAPSVFYRLTELHQSVLRRPFGSYATMVAQLRLMRVAMALLEYKQRNGAWPVSLDVLGAMPLDPFSGAPFRYERTEKGARIEGGELLTWVFED